jgi:choline kinase
MLAICVPVRESVAVKFSYSLAQLTAYLAKNNVPFLLFFEHGSILPQQRTNLVNSAISANCDEILWLDSDMVFPATIYNDLTQHSLDIVACTYMTRTAPYKNVAFVDSSDYNLRLDATSGLHEVYAVGLGCMLVKTQVYKTLPKPWFQFQYLHRHNGYKGEDIVFCELAAEHEYKIHVDVDTSKKVMHTAFVDIKLENQNV